MHRRPAFWLCLTVALYATYFLALTLTAHAAFETSASDLGIYDQIVWNTAHGRILAYSAEPWYGDSFLATHLQPILILVAPLYWLWSDVRALIVLQTLAVVAGALAIYGLAAWRLGRPWAALALTFAYLMFPAVQAINCFDFHPETFELFLFPGALALYEVRRGRLHLPRLSARWAGVLFWIAVVLALAVKEDVALVVAAAGAYLWVARRERRLGPALIVVAALWFGVGLFVVMPHFRGGQTSPFLSYYDYLGGSPAHIGRTLLTQPQLALHALWRPANAGMMFSLLAPLGFLSLLAPGVLLVAAPTLLSYALSTNEFMQRMEVFHYAAPVIPVLVISAIYGLARWHERRRTVPPWLPIAVLLVSSVAYQGARGFTPLSRYFRWPQVTEHQRVGLELMRQIPAGASLMAQDRLYPHLSQRESISFVWPAEGAVEYILLDAADRTLNNGDGLSEWLEQQVTRQAGYGLIAARDGFVLLQRGAPPQPLPDGFYSFARVAAPQIQHPLVADTAAGIRFLGYDVARKRDENAVLSLYFTATGQPAADYFVGLHLLDEKGATLGRTVFQQPALVWYPTSRWRAGEVVRVVANTVSWSAEPGRFGIGLVLAQQDAAA